MNTFVRALLSFTIWNLVFIYAFFIFQHPILLYVCWFNSIWIVFAVTIIHLSVSTEKINNYFTSLVSCLKDKRLHQIMVDVLFHYVPFFVLSKMVYMSSNTSKHILLGFLLSISLFFCYVTFLLPLLTTIYFKPWE